MIKDLFVLRDSKTGFTSRIMDAQPELKSDVIRSIGVTVNAPGTVISEYPEDFALYKVGTIDTDSGEVVPCLPDFVINAVDLRKDK